MRPRGSVRYDNRGRVVLVTGGARGIGLAVSTAFVESGAAVVIADVLQDVALPEDADYELTDVAQPDDCRRVIEHVVAQHGAVDVLVNPAQFLVKALRRHRRRAKHTHAASARDLDHHVTAMTEGKQREFDPETVTQ